VHQDIVLRKDASIGWAVRKNSHSFLTLAKPLCEG
jgi:hypothetical protein